MMYHSSYHYVGCVTVKVSKLGLIFLKRTAQFFLLSFTITFTMSALSTQCHLKVWDLLQMVCTLMY